MVKLFFNTRWPSALQGWLSANRRRSSAFSTCPLTGLGSTQPLCLITEQVIAEQGFQLAHLTPLSTQHLVLLCGPDLRPRLCRSLQPRRRHCLSCFPHSQKKDGKIPNWPVLYLFHPFIWKHLLFAGSGCHPYHCPGLQPCLWALEEWEASK